MTDPLEEMYRAWGRAKQRVNGTPPQPKSIMGRISEEGPAGAAIRGQPPDPLEVMLGDALAVSVAIHTAIDRGRLTLRQHEIFFAHYVCRGPVKVKCHRLKLSRRCYYERLSGAKAAIRDHIPPAGGVG